VLARHLPVAVSNVASIRRTQSAEQLSIGKSFQRRNVGFESARTFKWFVSGLGYRIVTLAKLVKYRVIRYGRTGYRMSDDDKRETEAKSEDSHAGDYHKYRPLLGSFTEDAKRDHSTRLLGS
jgi:hypothetical protein